MTRPFADWLDAFLAGDRTADSFARAAGLDEARPVETPVRYPTKEDAWPPEVWAEMEAIRKGEVE